MLASHDAVAMIAVKDLPAAKRFYEEVLGLEPVDAEGDQLVVFRSGDTLLNVYKSEYAGTNRATAVVWSVGDELEGMVDSLKAKGVTFEHYDMPGLTREGDVHAGGPMRVAWFKDPDGNILSIVNGGRKHRASHRKTGKTADGNGSEGKAGTNRRRPSAGRASRPGKTSKAGRG